MTHSNVWSVTGTRSFRIKGTCNGNSFQDWEEMKNELVFLLQRNVYNTVLSHSSSGSLCWPTSCGARSVKRKSPFLHSKALHSFIHSINQSISESTMLFMHIENEHGGIRALSQGSPASNTLREYSTWAGCSISHRILLDNVIMHKIFMQH